MWLVFFWFWWYFQTLWRFLRRFRYSSYKHIPWGGDLGPKQTCKNSLKTYFKFSILWSFLMILVVFSDSLALSASIPLFLIKKYPLGRRAWAKKEEARKTENLSKKRSDEVVWRPQRPEGPVLVFLFFKECRCMSLPFLLGSKGGPLDLSSISCRFQEEIP